MADWGFRVGRGNLADQWAELLRDVVDGLDQACAVADEAVATAADEAVNRAGDGEDLAVLLHRVVGRRERASPRGDLEDDDAQAEAGNVTVAPGEQVWAAIG